MLLSSPVHGLLLAIKKIAQGREQSLAYLKEHADVTAAIEKAVFAAIAAGVSGKGSEKSNDAE